MSSRGGRIVTGVMISMALGAMPFFFLGAFGPDIQSSLGLSEVRYGTIVGGYFMVAVVFSMPAGRLGEARGSAWSLSVAAIGIAVSLIGIGLARNGLQLAAAVLAGGLANTLIQPAGNTALAIALLPSRYGVAFALKQSAIPVAAILGGLAVPTVGTVIGWRWTVALISVLSLTMLVTARTVPTTPRKSARRFRPPSGSLARLAPLALAGFFGAAATTGMIAFFVDSATRGGVGSGAAGVWFAFGGIGGILGRLLAGWLVDHGAGRIDAGRVLVIFWMIGAAGFVLLAFADTWPLRVAATIPTFVCGWGWNGTIHLATVQWNPTAPSWSTGVTLTGLSLGGSLGPMIHGAVLGATTHRIAWFTTASMLAAAALIVEIGMRTRQTDQKDPARRPSVGT